MQDLAARKALIIKLANNYGWSASNFTKGELDSIIEATAKCSLDGLGRAVSQFMEGRVDEHNNSRMPTGAELAVKARLWDYATTDRKVERLVTYPIGELPPAPLVPLGPVEIDFGDGRINLRGLSHAEKEQILAAKGHPTERITNDVPKPRLKRL